MSIKKKIQQSMTVILTVTLVLACDPFGYPL